MNIREQRRGRAVNKYNAESLVKSVEVAVLFIDCLNSRLRLGLHLHLQKECWHC